MQGFFSFLMTAYAAPGLVGPDLSNNALPLYLCRPISKAEYVLGKMAVLLIPLSLITWVPGRVLGHAGRAGRRRWGRNNLHLLSGIILWVRCSGSCCCRCSARAVGLGSMEDHGERAVVRNFLHH